MDAVSGDLVYSYCTYMYTGGLCKLSHGHHNLCHNEYENTACILAASCGREGIVNFIQCTSRLSSVIGNSCGFMVCIYQRECRVQYDLSNVSWHRHWSKRSIVNLTTTATHSVTMATITQN